MKKAWISLFFSFVLIATSMSVFAQDDSEYLTYRQKLMQSNGMHMGLIGQIMQKNLPFKGHISSHATVLQQNAMLFAEAWEKKITTGKTDSKPEVWSNWNGFMGAAKASADAAKKLAGAGEADLMPSMRAMGGTCGGCHAKFRKPKSERFKR